MDTLKSHSAAVPLSTPIVANEINHVPSQSKTNHVSTVLLYDIPIVSLYIEGQERLCLAQISNTLLKQFSYNEIHNRRVALGITCVQCTPVQLEILRRAGAMPVSSRRCGMITRREAERLCKSFLGDNSPPRLPDDFAFSVKHKCAWGCRGSFLPSRYNSSRAKCIKCDYCGLYFSPNKFIFHSHRVSASDKYVQPDAANFNSWRRHMMLCGQPQEEIIHAWEDVKAMFNGGTRKRLVNSSVCKSKISPASLLETCIEPELPTELAGLDSKVTSGDGSIHPKRSRDQQYNYGTVTATAAVVGVTAVAAAVSAVHPSVIQPIQTLYNDKELSLIPFSRNLVMDYMWQHQQQQNSKKNNETGFPFVNCTLPWMKTETSSTITANGGLMKHSNQNSELSIGSHSYLGRKEPFLSKHHIFNITKSTETMSNEMNSADIRDSDTTSAFKPVFQNQQQQKKLSAMASVASAALVSASVFTTNSANSKSDGNVELDPRFITAHVAAKKVLNAKTAEQTNTTESKGLPSHENPCAMATNKVLAPPHQLLNLVPKVVVNGSPLGNRKSQSQAISSCQINNISVSSDEDPDIDDEEDEEMVDIETTEDDAPFNPHHPCNLSPAYTNFASNASESICNSPKNIDVDGITMEAEEHHSNLIPSNHCFDESPQNNNFQLNKKVRSYSANSNESRYTKSEENTSTSNLLQVIEGSIARSTEAEQTEAETKVTTSQLLRIESTQKSYHKHLLQGINQFPTSRIRFCNAENWRAEHLESSQSNELAFNNNNSAIASLHSQQIHHTPLGYKPELNVLHHQWNYPIGNFKHYFLQETSSTRANGVG